MCAGGISMGPSPENNEGGGAISEFDNMEHGNVANAAVEDDILDKLFVLDNLHPDPIPYSP